MNNDHKKSVALQLAEILQAKSQGDIEADVIHAAKRCIIDWTCAALAGTNSKQALALERVLSDELGYGSSFTLTGHTASMRTAALINGLASHIVEFDDIYAPGAYHPGSPTIAAALSAATGRKRTGLDLIRAVIAGYEVSNRVARALGTDHYNYWHTTGTAGCIAAAAAVSSVFQLNTAQTAHALATSTTMAAGLQNAFRGLSEIKPLHAGHAADSGFIAAGLAGEDIIAATDMFEGETGLGAAMSGDVDWSVGLGEGDENTIMRTTIKNHGCCGHIFPALDGVMALQAKHGFSAEEITSITVGAYSATVNVTANYLADSPATAKFCLPFIVASGLIHGSIRLDAYSEQRLKDPAVLSLMEKITVKLDLTVDTLFPSQRSANVIITLNNGKRLHKFQPHRVGDPELPLSDRQLDDKFMELSGTVLTTKQAEMLLKNLWVLENQKQLDFYYGR